MAIDVDSVIVKQKETARPEHHPDQWVDLYGDALYAYMPWSGSSIL